ncbi:MAG: archease [candidate division NC10 bacterium]|nr:archease [candidate division NC10 bacterium]
MPEAPFQHFDVTADFGLMAQGSDLKEAFVNVASGMLSLLIDPEEVRREKSHPLEVKAPDRESLLVAWLNELLYLFDAEGFLSKDFQILELDETYLKAEVWGEPIDPDRHHFKGYVKAATYHQLEVKEGEGGWQVRVVFDV